MSATRASVELTSEVGSLEELCREFATAEISLHAAKWWHEGRCPTETLGAMGKLDLLGLLVPPESGGTDTSTRALVAALLEVARVDQSIAAAWQAHLTIGSLPLLAFGSEEQKQRWLVTLASGERLGSFGLTGPAAGSEASGVRTEACRSNGGWSNHR